MVASLILSVLILGPGTQAAKGAGCNPAVVGSIPTPASTKAPPEDPPSDPQLVILTDRWFHGTPLLDLRQFSTIWAFPQLKPVPFEDEHLTRPGWTLEVLVGETWHPIAWPNLRYGVAVSYRGSLPEEVHDRVARYPFLGVRGAPSKGVKDYWPWVEGRTPSPYGWKLRPWDGGQPGLTKIRFRVTAPDPQGGTQVTPPVDLWVLR